MSVIVLNMGDNTRYPRIVNRNKEPRPGSDSNQFSLVQLDDPLAGCQTDTGARVSMAGVQTLENTEYEFFMLGRDTYPVIGNSKSPQAVHCCGSNMDRRRSLRAPIFYRYRQYAGTYVANACSAFFPMAEVRGNPSASFLDHRGQVFESG
jgi:hypothetical protein